MERYVIGRYIPKFRFQMKNASRVQQEREFLFSSMRRVGLDVEFVDSHQGRPPDGFCNILKYF